MEKLKELRVMNYDNLEKRMILSIQEVFHAQFLSFIFNLAIPEPIFFVVGTLHG